jgi:hypothetical protein
MSNLVKRLALGLCLLAGASGAGLCASIAGYQGRHVAAFEDGERLFGQCTDAVSEGACLNYIAGIADAMTNRNPIYRAKACVPDNVQIYQLRDVVVGFLRDHPEIRQQVGAQLVASAFQQSFPC